MRKTWSGSRTSWRNSSAKPPSTTVSTRKQLSRWDARTARTSPAGILLLRSDVLCGAALLRPMVPLIPKTLPELKATPVLVSAGNQDPIVPAENARQLVALLRSAGADVTISFENAGHSLTDCTIEIAKRWLAEKKRLAALPNCNARKWKPKSSTSTTKAWQPAATS